MQNLSGERICDRVIEDELEEAGITVLRDVNGGFGNYYGDVPYSVIGVLGEWYDVEEVREALRHIRLKASDVAYCFKYVFERAWRYWVVRGPVPLPVARELYEHPVGKTLRVAGLADRLPPDKEKNGSLLLAKPYEGPLDEEGAAVYLYHIDSQEGLNLFVKVLRKHGLTRVNRQFKLN